MKLDFISICSQLAGLVWGGLRSFLGTVLGFALFGSLLAALSYYFLDERHSIYCVIAAALALAESVAAGFFIGIKRAVTMPVVHGLGSLRLGRALVILTFDRLLDADARDGKIAQAISRLPLGQAEEKLSKTIRDLTGDVERIGFLRRKIQAYLLDVVKKYTLARFREEGNRHGGIDLLKAKEELQETVDEILANKLRGELRFWVVLAIIVLPVLVAVQTWLIYILP